MVLVNVVWNIKSTTNGDACAHPWQSMPGNHCKSQQGLTEHSETTKEWHTDYTIYRTAELSKHNKGNGKGIPHSYPKEDNSYGGRKTIHHKSSEKNMGTN